MRGAPSRWTDRGALGDWLARGGRGINDGLRWTLWCAKPTTYVDGSGSVLLVLGSLTVSMRKMRSKALVSVIIPFLNTERFIQEAIDSVFAQTYDHWELWLVDDGSIDGSTQIARRYAEEHPQKVHYLEHDNHQNLGVCVSRNLGIRHAKGEYIALLDADDVWLSHKLERQVAILSSQPEAAMVYGATQYWNSWTGNPEDLRRDYVPDLGVRPDRLIQPPALLPVFLRGTGAVPSPCDIIVRQEVMESTGGFVEDFWGMYEDQVFYAKVCLKAAIFVASECWDRYRLHPDSACAVAQKTGRYYDARPAFLTWLEEYLSVQGIKDGEVWQSLQKELWPYRHPTLSRVLRHAQHPIWLMKERFTWIARRLFRGVDGREET
jgi:glycosyltransferase involved in cell wall biosynthesis